jgi:hypothetical protein
MRLSAASCQHFRLPWDNGKGGNRVGAFLPKMGSSQKPSKQERPFFAHVILRQSLNDFSVPFEGAISPGLHVSVSSLGKLHYRALEAGSHGT